MEDLKRMKTDSGNRIAPRDLSHGAIAVLSGGPFISRTLLKSSTAWTS